MKTDEACWSDDICPTVAEGKNFVAFFLELTLPKTSRSLLPHGQAV